MAVDAGQTGPLMKVGGQLMVTDPVRLAPRFVWGREWGPEVRVEVMLKTAMVVGTYPVPVVTAQALAVRGSGQKPVVRQFAVRKSQMAPPATAPMPGGRIGLTLGVEVAAQTPAAEEIIGQLQGSTRGLLLGDGRERGQGFPSAKGLADQIDLVGPGKVKGGGGLFDNRTMALAADLTHALGMGRLLQQTGMGLGLGAGGPITPMALLAGEEVVGIQGEGVAPPATDRGLPPHQGRGARFTPCCRGRRRDGSGGRLTLGATGNQGQDQEQRGQDGVHLGDGQGVSREDVGNS